jgi:hypothetical protein
MKFLVLALDFDRTIAQHDVPDPEVHKAISELRGRGIVVILVTGRIISDLRRVCGALHFVDAVVAENGAFIEFPATGYSMSLAASPPAALLQELRNTGIVHTVNASSRLTVVTRCECSAFCNVLSCRTRRRRISGFPGVLRNRDCSSLPGDRVHRRDLRFVHWATGNHALPNSSEIVNAVSGANSIPLRKCPYAVQIEVSPTRPKTGPTSVAGDSPFQQFDGVAAASAGNNFAARL